MQPPRASLADAPPAARLARALASPTGVLILLPVLVIAAGLTVLLLGRRATVDASDSMARDLLSAQASDVQHEVAFALDQASPLLDSLRLLADPALPIDDVASRLRDLVVGRPGIANVSIAFPDGTMRGTYLDEATGELRAQQSTLGASGTQRINIAFAPAPHIVSTETTTYDPRTRPHYQIAVAKRARVWMPPRTFFTSHKTGLTVVEPFYTATGELHAVATVDFDVTALSSFIARPPFDGARTVMFAGDGTILAFPGVAAPAIATAENRLLRHEDYNDPALEALFRSPLVNAAVAAGRGPNVAPQFAQLATSDGGYLASIAPVGGRRAAIDAPLDWYLTTLVPERVLLGPTHRLERQSALASGGALAIAMGVALMFAWNLVRMRRAVGAARAAARSAEARAKELGSYRLVERLGVGGMGEVWRAEHRLLARAAAIKLVRPEALADPRYAPKVRERFRREAQTLASMRSRNTIALFDYGVSDDRTFFYVMELLDGVDLDKLVREHGAQSPARVIQLMIQACGSLAEAHDAGLLHRDIKPANLVTSRQADEVDILKVLDFGIVQVLSDPSTEAVEGIVIPETGERVPTPSGRLTLAGAVIGTPGYIAPEQARGGAIDGRADLYALACVAWWLLTGNEVFARPDDDTAMYAHETQPVPSLATRVRGWLPAELEAVLTACLGKRPEDRPHDARAFAAALAAIEIPEEHAWTRARAIAWWTEHLPAPAPTPRVSAADISDAPANSKDQLLVPQREADATPDAKTIADHPSAG